jgi:hypothetical protein|tara:strand:- start:53762 stop:54253 length:492 start_codon:yes stop_codon:yes gene_type:complete
MMGTELDTAYFDSSLDLKSENLSINNVIQQQSENKTTQNDISEHPKIVGPEYIRDFSSMDKSHSNTIDELKKQLKFQQELNIAYQKDAATLYDRFASKKKDVLKLLAISLTVLLAISTNFVMSDLIKKYLMNNDFNDTKETIIKLMYPFTTFMLLWSTKVFNK